MLYAVCPSIPYHKNFKFDVEPGFQLTVTGHVHAEYFRGLEPPNIRGFSINLAGENGLEGDIILHFNPRFDDKVVVLNTMTNGSWGPEERPSAYPFNDSDDFTVNIQAHSDEFKIFVNGHHFVDYKYRLSLSSVTGIIIKGLVTVHQVIAAKHEIGAVSAPNEHHSGAIVANSELPIVVEKPEIPVEISIPGHVQPGMVFAFVGKVLENAARFHINWLTHNKDRAFHFNPRFEGGDAVVRNTKIGGQWGSEERGGNESPFRRDTKFRLFVKVQPSHYEVWVNGAHFCNYKHRVEQLHDVNAVQIAGDVKIKLVKITY